MEKNPNISFVYGACNYINSDAKKLGYNRSGKWAVKLIRFGPDLIPQPGALIRRESLEKIGYLDKEFTHAFDMKMFLELLKVGDGYYVEKILASFRWHTDSLSVKSRKDSVLQASRIRREQHNKIVSFFSLVWEIPIILLTFTAGLVVNQRIKMTHD